MLPLQLSSGCASASPCPSLPRLAPACLALPQLALPHLVLLSFRLVPFLFYSTPASCQPEPALQMFVLLFSLPLYLSLRFPHCSIFVYFADEAKGAVENAMKLSIRRGSRGGKQEKPEKVCIKNTGSQRTHPHYEHCGRFFMAGTSAHHSRKG